MTRYGVYFAPAPEHPLWQAGCAWLGRDACVAPPTPPARPEVEAPWRYGWHATLKAPLRLAAGADEPAWLAAVAGLAARHAAFAMPTLEVARLDDFLALRPVQPLDAGHPLRRLADDCVRTLDIWRAPPNEAERARREGASLTERQREHVARYGYPHVLDDWRFHMTLSGPLAQLDSARAAALCAEAEQHFAAALATPLRCDALAVFVEAAPGAPFEWRHRFALTSG